MGVAGLTISVFTAFISQFQQRPVWLPANVVIAALLSARSHDSRHQSTLTLGLFLCSFASQLSALLKGGRRALVWAALKANA